MWKKVSFKEFFGAKDVAKLSELPSFNAILSGLNPDTKTNASPCRPRLFRAYKNNIWAYRVNCTGETYSVWLKTEDSGGKLPDIKVKCSCPHWKWGGSDYNAYKDDYLYGKPFSNLKFPSERDPGLENKVCKHVYSMMLYAKNNVVWETAEPKVKTKPPTKPTKPTRLVDRDKPERGVPQRRERKLLQKDRVKSPKNETEPLNVDELSLEETKRIERERREQERKVKPQRRDDKQKKPKDTVVDETPSLEDEIKKGKPKKPSPITKDNVFNEEE